jgi:hypothetical protein
MTQTIYTLTSKIHVELTRLGLEIEVNSIQAPQIRRILRALEEDLGSNPDIDRWQKQADEVKPIYFGDECMQYYQVCGNIMMLPKTLAEALCSRWLDGLDPLFEREPETVLEELLEVLENLRK